MDLILKQKFMEVRKKLTRFLVKKNLSVFDSIRELYPLFCPRAGILFMWWLHCPCSLINKVIIKGNVFYVELLNEKLVVIVTKIEFKVAIYHLHHVPLIPELRVNSYSQQTRKKTKIDFLPIN